MRHALWIMVFTAAALGCSKKNEACTVTSVGSCAAQGASCGATLSCQGKTYELKCTVPGAPDAKQTDCQCIDGGVIGKTVQMTYPLHATAEAVQSACGWK